MNAVIQWDENDNPISKSIDTVLYGIRADDKDGLIYDAVTMQEIIEDSDGYLATFDSLITPYARLGRKMEQLVRVMNKSVPDFSVVSHQISKPFRQRGGVHVAVIFELTDGQTITIYFHSPVLDPKKIMPNDELVSWKWMINKKDVTIVVAPEKGKDIPVREVGRRVMKLAHRNSSAFQKANEKRAERLKEIADYEKEIAELEAKLADLLKQIEVAKLEKEERELKALEKPIEDRVGEKMKGNGWTEIFEGNNTILRKYYDGTEIKASLIDKQVTLVADPVKEIQSTLKLRDSDNFINKTVEEAAESLAMQLAEENENKVTDHEYFIHSLSTELERMGWKIHQSHKELLTKDFEDKSVRVDLEKEGTVNVFVSQEYQLNIETQGETINDLANKIDDSAKELLLKKQAEIKIKELADAVLKLNHSVNYIDPQNIVITTVRFGAVVNVGIDDYGDYEYISKEIEESYLEEQGQYSSKIAQAIDEVDFILKMEGSFSEDRTLPSHVVQGGVFKGKTYEFARTIESIEIAVNKIPELVVVFGDFNHTGGTQGVLFDSVISESNPPIYGITAQIGFKDTAIILARIEVEETGEAIIYKGEGGKSKYRSGDLRKPTVENIFNALNSMIKELEPKKEWEDDKPLVTEYLNQFTPLRRGQIKKQLSKSTYDDDGVIVSVAEYIIDFVKTGNSGTQVNSDGDKTVSNGTYVLNVKKFGKLAINFGIWLVESKGLGKANIKENLKKPKVIVTTDKSSKLKNEVLGQVNLYISAVREYEKSDAKQQLEQLKPKVEAMLAGEMESASDRDRLNDILPTVNSILDGTYGVDPIPEEDPREVELFNRAVDEINADNIEYVKSLSDSEYQEIFNILVDRNYHPEARKFETMRNHKEPELTVLQLLEKQLIDRYGWKRNSEGQIVKILNDDEFFTFSEYEGKIAVTFFNAETTDQVVVKKFSDFQQDASLLERKTQAYIAKLEADKPQPNPENNNMVSVEKFLDDMINHPENHTGDESYEKLESVIANQDEVPSHIYDKAAKALEVYSSYALARVAEMMQEAQEQIKQASA